DPAADGAGGLLDRLEDDRRGIARIDHDELPPADEVAPTGPARHPADGREVEPDQPAGEPLDHEPAGPAGPRTVAGRLAVVDLVSPVEQLERAGSRQPEIELP